MANSVKVLRMAVHPWTADQLRVQAGDHLGRTSEKDVNKSLEESIARLYFPSAQKIEPPHDRIEEYRGIDLWVDGHSVQIKCNGSSKLVLEDAIQRNGEWLPGCIDNCDAEIFLHCWAVDDIVYMEGFQTSFLKAVLNASRKFTETKEIDPILTYVGGPGRWCHNKSDGRNSGSFFIY